MKLKLKISFTLFGILFAMIFFQNCGEGFVPNVDNLLSSGIGAEPTKVDGIEIQSRPVPFTNSSATNIVFKTSSFEDSEILTTRCSLDGGLSQECTSPISVEGLTEGIHTFEIEVQNLKGSKSTLKISWMVDLVPAEISISAGPVSLTEERAASIEFSVSDLGGLDKITCSLNGVEVSPCSSPQVFSGLEEGDYTFKLSATDKAGNITTTEHIWRVGVERILAIEGDQKLLLSIDIKTGNRTIISGGGIGLGPAFGRIYALVLSSDKKTAYISGVTAEGITPITVSILAVDLLTGNRTLVSGATRGTGYTELLNALSMELGKNGDKLYISTTRGVFEVDIATGNRVLLSGIYGGNAATNTFIEQIGTGPEMVIVGGLTLHPSGNSLYVASSANDAIVSIDLTTRVRTTVFGGLISRGDVVVGTGGTGYWPTKVVFDPSGNKAYLVNFAYSLLGVDLLTRVSTRVSYARPLVAEKIGSGADFSDSLRDIDLSIKGGVAYVTEPTKIVEVNLLTGARRELSSATVGTGPLFTNLYEISVY